MPCKNSRMSKLKRIGRYLVGKPRVVLKYDFQNFTNTLKSCVDSDHAGCLKTRKSTNGGALKLGDRCLKSWSTTQAVTALSSGEAEFYGIVKGSAVLLGMISIAQDLGMRSGKYRISTQFVIDKQGNIIDLNIRAPHTKL